MSVSDQGRPAFALIWEGGMMTLHRKDISGGWDIHRNINALIKAGAKRVSMVRLLGMDGYWQKPYDWHEVGDKT